MVRPLTRMAPVLKPGDLQQGYVYGLDAESIRQEFLTHLAITLAELPEHVDTEWEPYLSLALTVRDRLIERWVHTQNAYYAHDAKRVYYLSLEFLMGRTLTNSLVNLGFLDAAAQAVHELGYHLEDLREAEWDAGLGNGGLGRLAACFLDSLATLALPAYGYGIRYEYGMFHQRIVNGYQVETPDAWLRYGNPWEIPRPHDFFRVKFYGRVHQYVNAQGRLTTDWVDTEDVLTLPYDTPISGYQNGTVNTLRLWSAKATDEFDLRYFNHGDYEGAVEAKSRSENITRVLYPNDNIFEGQELRLKQEYFFVSATLQDIIRIWPEKFSNKTNGITPRRWLKKANPPLSTLITEAIGEGWVTDLFQLKRLAGLATDAAFADKWRAAKRHNKLRLLEIITSQYQRRGQTLTLNPDSLFDCQVKRIHEYKRQLLNAMHAITLYNRIKDNPHGNHLPRTIIFGGKAAPGYVMAKLIIKLINAIGDKVNHDAEVGGLLRVVFLADYRVSLAERIFPAAELSEQISTAGTEASGTGNMKFALNGALTIGTMDGANVEIREEVGDDNIFIFGLTAAQVTALKPHYNPGDYYEQNPELRRAIEQIRDGFFSPEEPGLFRDIFDTLLGRGRDHYLLLADYGAYVACQERVSDTYRCPDEWTKKSILNVAHMGKFSTDRTIKEYADEIWGLKPVPIAST